MAIIVATTQAKALLIAIKEKIDTGHIVTWSYDQDGDFTHATDQWKNQAWLHPAASLDGLRLFIIAPRQRSLSREVYGVYHGRFIEMLLAHFDSRFVSATASAMPEGQDKLSGG